MIKFNAFFVITGLILGGATSKVMAQIAREIDPIICYSHDFAETERVPVSRDIEEGSNLRLSEFVFQFTDSVPANVQEVIHYAGMIWESKLVSSVPIRVNVDWTTYDEANILASAGPTTIYRDFTGATDPLVWYPVALAEALARTNFNDQEADIDMTINSKAAWYYLLDGKTPRNRIDMLSVILHEIGHGLGFFSSADVQGDTLGVLGYDGLPMIYDTYLANSQDLRLDNENIFANPSKTLLTEFTSNELFFAGDLVAEFYTGLFPPLYAPMPFELGSSISHLDEQAFPAGSLDALMSPFIAFGESVHDPGNVTLAIMTEIGWDAQFNISPVFEGFVAAAPLKLYPNPAQQYVELEIPTTLNNQDVLVQVFDLQGRPCLQQWLPAKLAKQQITTATLENGTYLLRLIADKKLTSVQPLIVQH